MKLLVVEDERMLCDTIAKSLHHAGYEVDCCYDGAEALERLLIEQYDLIVLDLHLPGMDGMEVLERLRQTDAETKVLILSARSQVADKVAGLDAGANDYLEKPFHLQELAARVRSLTRRQFIQQSTALVCGGISFDTRTRETLVNGKEIRLTRKEKGILEYLLLHQGRPISQEELMEHIWEADANPFSNAVRMHISSLRKKLRKRLGHDPIQTKVGRGYRLAGEETA